jgi:hypothetical protein
MTNREADLIEQITQIGLHLAELKAENKILKSVNDRLLQALPVYGVMQAEGSDVSEGATVASEGQGEANTCAGFCECTKPRGDINHFGCMNCQKQIRA